MVTPWSKEQAIRIEVRFRGLDSSEALREHAARRILSHLSRFGREVTDVLVRVADVNGPKGGVDKQCQITVRGPRLGSAAVQEMSGDAYSAVDMATERLGRSVGRELERARDRRTRGKLGKLLRVLGADEQLA